MPAIIHEKDSDRDLIIEYSDLGTDELESDFFFERPPDQPVQRYPLVDRLSHGPLVEDGRYSYVKRPLFRRKPESERAIGSEKSSEKSSENSSRGEKSDAAPPEAYRDIIIAFGLLDLLEGQFQEKLSLLRVPLHRLPVFPESQAVAEKQHFRCGRFLPPLA